MDKQIKAPMGIKIIIVIMFLGQLWMTLPSYFPFGMEIFDLPPLHPEEIHISETMIEVDGKLVPAPPLPEDVGLHPEAIKMKSIERSKIDYLVRMAEIIILAPLVIIAVIGLWKMREWGLFTVLIAFGARILLIAIYNGPIKLDSYFCKMRYKWYDKNL